MVKLDIGCGNLNSVHSGDHVFFNSKDVIHIDIKKKSYHLEVQTSVNSLPFKDNFFDISYLSHVLEHLENPLLALKEIKRVTKKTVVVRVPNASYFRFKDEHEEHLFSWTPSTIESLLNKVFTNVKITTSKRYNKKRNYIKKIVFAIATLFLKNNEIVIICKC